MLKRLSASKNYPIKRKEYKYTVQPRSGPHQKNECIPLQIILRDKLNFAKTAKESKTILNDGKVLVDGKIRKDYAYPCGLMDVISIPNAKKQYRVFPINGKLDLLDITEKESDLKLCKINDKKYIKGDLLQLNLHDGRNLNVNKDDVKKYKTGDTVVIKVPEQKIIETLILEQNVSVVITQGKHTGIIGKVIEIKTTNSTNPNTATIELNNKEKIVTRLNYLFVIGKDKAIIKIPEQL
ncbi:MAG: 30S ribosomal protein S4e [DPANN group archaeon]|nr:30S ribosomal protein S4e [DPANN group archaeon]